MLSNMLSYMQIGLYSILRFYFEHIALSIAKRALNKKMYFVFAIKVYNKLIYKNGK